MEKSKFDKVNLDAQPKPEAFSIRDGATGKPRSVREMTDQELECHTNEAMQQVQIHNDQMKSAINNVMQVTSILAVLQFEIDRRSRLIAISFQPRS